MTVLNDLDRFGLVRDVLSGRERQARAPMH